jgi:hypothetical protein
MVRVRSRNVWAVGYDADTCELRVELRDGSLFAYAGVEEAVHAEFMAVPSKGNFLDRVLREHYPVQQLAPGGLEHRHGDPA